MQKKKILIITYYWPPSGGSGVQRWLYFSKYLRENGWEPIIFTAQNPDYPIIDKTLAKEIPSDITVIRQPIWEPYTIYKRLIGMNSTEGLPPNIVQQKQKRSFLHTLSVWIRGNFFIPDARKFWIRPSVKRLTSYLKKNHIDIIVSTSPPQTPHLIALALKKKFKIIWIADFRDPWTGISYFEELKLSNSAKKKHHQLEKEVLQAANKVLTVSNKWASDFERLGAENVSVITNGYESKEKNTKPYPNSSLEDCFIISHIGMLSASRNPSNLWIAIKTAIEEQWIHKKIIIRFIGKVEEEILEEIRHLGLQANLEYLGYLPKDDAKLQMKAADILLLIGIPKEKGVIPGKFFEYLHTQKSIFSISPTGSDISKIIEEMGCGENIDFNDTPSAHQAVLKKILLNNDSYKTTEANYQQYTRQTLTTQLARLLNELTQ